MKIILNLCLSLVALLLISACNHQATDNNTLKIGTISGPETEIMETAKDVAAKKYGLNIEIVEFNDYTLPNLALNEGSLDANMFQHLPYLKTAIRERHYDLAVIGKTFIYPMAVYSQKIKSLQALRKYALVGIPNDPSNSARALLLLAKAELIKLKDPSQIEVTINDISENPKNLQIKEIDAAQLPRSLADLDIAVMNSNYAMAAGLQPSRDSLFLEGTDSNYANIVAARNDNKNDPRLKKLMMALHSDEVLKKAKELFKSQAIPAW